MSWRCSGATNSELIDNLLRAKIIRDGRVATAMKRVDRAAYSSKSPYQDSPQRIGFGATISAPHMHGYALEWLASHLKPGSKVLDVGCGSGYLTACFAEMVRGQNGSVYGIDHIEGLVELSRANIRQGNPDLLAEGHVSVSVRDGFVGLSDQGPFDVIHVGAAAPTLPQELVTQLAPGGKMVIPVGPDGGAQEILSVTKAATTGAIEQSSLMSVRYIPLTTPDKQLKREL